MSKRRTIRLLPAWRGDPRASLAAFLIQVALIAIVVPAFVVPVAFEFLRDGEGRIVSPERITFIATVPDAGPPTRESPRDGGDGRTPEAEPSAEARAPAPLVAPVAVPSELPPAPLRAASDPGIGPLVGGGGPTQGIRPSFNDPRLWRVPADVVTGPLLPMTRADSLNAILHETALAFVDSLARSTAAAGRAPGDWTFDRNGKKYGIDPKFIHLGSFSLPTMVLAFLPLNAQENPMVAERARRLASMRSEIIDQAARMQREDDFRAAVRALRERKEKERREAEEKKRASQQVIP